MIPTLVEMPQETSHISSAVVDGPADVPSYEAPKSKKEGSPAKPTLTSAEQRTRDWAAQHGKRKESMTGLELAGAEMREADEWERRRQQQQRTDHDREGAGMRLRAGREPNQRLDGRNGSFGVRAPN